MFRGLVFRCSRLAWLAVLFLSAASRAFGQTVIDPQRVEFTPSSEHSAVDTSGGALVQLYRLDVYVAGQSTVSTTANLGKPAPGTDGLIRLSFLSLLSTPLVPGVTYEARVTAVGPYGSTASSLSNTFFVALPCAPSLSPTALSIAAVGGNATAVVTAGTGCAWTAVSNASWITVTAGASGSGNGSVGYAVAANSSSSTRTGTLTIGGQTLTVTQGGVPCSFSISPTAQSVAGSAVTGTVAVTAPGGCLWTTLSNASWLTISSGVIGTGNGTVGYAAAANATTSPRTGTMTIAGQTFTVTQAVRMSELTSPVAGATNVDTSWPFTWTSTSGALAYRLTLGTTAGASDLVDTGEIPQTSYAASNLPGGQLLHARLWTKLTATTSVYSDSSFTTVNRATFTNPTNNATAVDPATLFSWTAAPGAVAYYLYVGTTSGSNNVVNTGETPGTSYQATGLPQAQTLYARIWTKFPTYWDFSEVVFSTKANAVFVYPTNNLANVNPAQPFSWTPAPGALGYRLTVGSSAGASDLSDSGEVPGTSWLVSSLPSNQLLFARIATHFGTGWQSQDIQFTATRGAYFLSPTEGSLVGVSCTPVQWSPVSDAQAYYLYIGTTAGAKNLMDTGEIPYTSVTAPILPANQQIFARIWTKFATGWSSTDVGFSTVLSTLTSPADNATGIGTTGTIQWTAVPGASKYYLYVGDTPGSNNRINSGEVTQTSYPMTGLPVGVQLYAQLWTKMNGCWTAAPIVTFRP